jgi:hypothetical protein
MGQKTSNFVQFINFAVLSLVCSLSVIKKELNNLSLLLFSSFVNDLGLFPGVSEIL